MSVDEEAALKDWKEYHAAIKKMGLDNPGKYPAIIEFMYDSYFTGFYAGRDHERGKHQDE